MHKVVKEVNPLYEAKKNPPKVNKGKGNINVKTVLALDGTKTMGKVLAIIK